MHVYTVNIERVASTKPMCSRKTTAGGTHVNRCQPSLNCAGLFTRSTKGCNPLARGCHAQRSKRIAASAQKQQVLIIDSGPHSTHQQRCEAMGSGTGWFVH